MSLPARAHEQAEAWHRNILANTQLLHYFMQYRRERSMNGTRQAVAERMPVDRQRLALEGFFGIMEHWGVDNAVSPPNSWLPAERTFYEWKKGKARRVPEDTLRRIGYVAGIWKGLQIVYSNPSLPTAGSSGPTRFSADRRRWSAWRPAT